MLAFVSAWIESVLSVNSTLKGQIIACHVDCQTVAEQGTVAMFHAAHI